MWSFVNFYQLFFFFFNDTATTEIYTLSLHDALPIWATRRPAMPVPPIFGVRKRQHEDRKSTRLNSSHITISYAVFCLKKKKKQFSIFKSKIKKTKIQLKKIKYYKILLTYLINFLFTQTYITCFFVFFFFFFLMIRRPPRSTPFPTRRSSDLLARKDRLGQLADWRHMLVPLMPGTDRKSTRLNSSHITISYAVFCLKKKKPARLGQPRAPACHCPAVHRCPRLRRLPRRAQRGFFFF